MTNIESIGKRVLRRRLSRGWTQADLCKRTGLSTGHISDIENGNRKDLQIDTIKKLARGLEMDLIELIGEECGREVSQ